MLEFANHAVESGKLNIGPLVLHLPADESGIVFKHFEFAGQSLHHGVDLGNKALRYHNGVGRCVAAAAVVFWELRCGPWHPIQSAGYASKFLI